MRLILVTAAALALAACESVPRPTHHQIELAAQIAAEVAKAVTEGR